MEPLNDSLTVGNVLARLYGSYPEAVANCEALGIDPDTSLEQFQRWLRYGKKADLMAMAGMEIVLHAE